MRPPLKRGLMRHTISVLVENKFGVLTRVAGLFSGRGYNIDSLNVAPTQDSTVSRMTIVTRGDDATVDQIVKQLNKLVNVINVHDFQDIGQLVKLLNDLVESGIVAASNDGHAGDGGVLRGRDVERVNVVTPAAEQPCHAGECAEFVLHQH